MFLEVRAGLAHNDIIWVLICVLEKGRVLHCLGHTPGLCPCQGKGTRLGEDGVHSGRVLPWVLGSKDPVQRVRMLTWAWGGVGREASATWSHKDELLYPVPKTVCGRRGPGTCHRLLRVA